MDTPFIVEKNEELLALHRVFIEAKFSANPNDRDISASPIVCELYKRIFDRLKTDGKDWDGWLKKQKNRFLQTIRSNLKGIASWEWKKWSEEKKKTYVRDSAFPLVLTDQEIEELIELGNETN